MITEDFSNVHLTGWEIFTLRRLSFNMTIKCPKNADSIVTAGYVEYIEYKTDDIGQWIPASNKIRISEKGVAFLKYREQRFIKDYLFDIVNFVIAILALLISLN